MEDAALTMATSVPASHLAMVDSSKRNSAHFPTPSRFDVVFDTPFRMVYGIDVLSVTIPRTEYNTSASRNVLTFSFGAPGANQRHMVTVSEGDYDNASILTATNAALDRFVSAAGNTLTLVPATAVQTVSNKVVFVCAEPFTLYLSSSSLRSVVGFGYPVDPSYPGYAAPDWVVGGPDTVSSVLSPSSNVTTPAFLGPPAATPLPLTSGHPLQQTFVSAAAGIITQINIVTGCLGNPPSSNVYWSVTTADGVPVGGGVVVADYDSTGRTSLGGYSTAHQPVTAGSTYVLTLTDPTNADSGNCTTVYVGAANPTSDTLAEAGALGLARGGVGVAGSALTGSVVAQPGDQRVWAPGLVDLTGERYLILRCLEVETAINGSRAFEGFNAGIAFIQLGTFGYSQQGYDYSAYPPRIFQPISYLSKLSLSFEKPDGSLYDFKGLNLEMLILIRYLVPKKSPPTTQHVPHYTPYLPYVNSQMARRAVENDPKYSWCAR